MIIPLPKFTKRIKTAVPLEEAKCWRHPDPGGHASFSQGTTDRIKCLCAEPEVSAMKLTSVAVLEESF